MATVQDVLVPDIGDFQDVDVIEVLVSAGDTVAEEDPLLTLETDKATMDVPAPTSGVVQDVKIQVGDKVSQGTLILTMEPGTAALPEPPSPAGIQEPDEKPPVVSSPVHAAAPQSAPAPMPSAPPGLAPVDEKAFAEAYASPSVRRFARELGVDLGKLSGSGAKGRILQEDVQAYVKGELTRPRSEQAAAPAAAPASGSAIPPIPSVDYSKFGETDVRPMSRINKISAAHLHRCWLNVPHVTQFDEADITDLESYRAKMKDEAKKQGFGLTILAFLMKASVAALKKYPRFNSALDPDGANLIFRHYYHIGVAVDTPDGLMVPVIRDVDRKGLFELAEALAEVSARARDGKLTPTDMQGGCFSISSLGGIGGSAFTPIVNAPEVAILGVSRSKPRLEKVGGEFVERLMLPLSLSYDHRVIDGAAAARFTTYLSFILSDVRNLVL